MKSLSFIVLALLLGCSPTSQPTSGADQEVPAIVAEKPHVPSTAEAWSRLRPVYWTAQDGSRFIAPWSWWVNPAGQWLPDYAADVYGPLRDNGVGLPLSWRPFYDSKLAGPCWFYRTDDSAGRCLPGWAQMDADDERDGFYVDPTCHSVNQWLFVLPTSETQGVLAQKFLVLVMPTLDAVPSVYGATPFTGRVWQRRLATDGSRECAEFTGDRLKFFHKGDKQPLGDYVPLGSPNIDIGPG